MIILAVKIEYFFAYQYANIDALLLYTEEERQATALVCAAHKCIEQSQRFLHETFIACTQMLNQGREKAFCCLQKRPKYSKAP